MLSQAIGGSLPSAVGVALSPLPIVAVILMLGTPKARSTGIAFALGWIVGLAAVSAVVLLVVPASTPGSTSADGVRWGTLCLGVLFVLMALRQLRKRPRGGAQPETPTWMAAIDGFTTPRSGALGVALSALNPKNLALTAAAAAAIAQQGLPTGGDVVAVTVFVVIASLTIVGPVVLFLVAERRVAGLLQTIKTFMMEHNAVIMFVVLLVLGVKLIGSGIAG